MVPSTYEDGTLYNVLPSGNKAPDKTGNHNGYDQTRADFTFSRGSNLSATRIGPSGLIEKGRANYILYSQEFDNAYWNKLGVSITANQTTAPDGTLTADLLDDGTSTGNKFIEENEVIGGGVASMSIHAKYVDTQYLVLAAYDTSYKAAAFDILNGTLGNSDSALIPAIEDLGDGWYRCSIAYPGNTRNDPYISIGIREDNVATLPNQTGANRQVYIWGAQLENGLVATDYIETGSVSGTAGVLENTPRIDYSSGAGSLKLEPQRTNVVTNSEYVSSNDYVVANWTGTITTNTTETTSPEGVYNATKYVKSGASDRVYFHSSQPDGAYTGSVWLKAASGSENTTIEISVRRFGGGGGSTSKLVTITNEWQRFDVTATNLTGGTTTAMYVADFSMGGTATEFYSYGMQIEAGSYASSYIPTYGSAATRGADSCYVDYANAHPNDEGTIFFEVGNYETNSSASGFNKILVLNEVSSSNLDNVIYFEEYAGENTILIRKGGSTLLQSTPNYQDLRGSKIAIKWNSSEAKIFIDGSLNKTYTGDASLSPRYIGYDNPYNGQIVSPLVIKEQFHFNEALSDSECISLTS